MTVDQLRYFVTVASTRSFSQTAELEITSQSTVSKQIKNLESELGVTLFARYNRKIEITEAGTQLLPDAKAIISRVDSMSARVKRLSLSSQNSISVISLPFTAPYGLNPLFQQFMKEQPKVNIEVSEMEERELLENLSIGNGDIYLLRENSALDNDLPYKSVAHDKMSLFISETHPLAQNHFVSLNQLSDESFVCLPEDSGIFRLIKQGCEKAGFTPNAKGVKHTEYILSQVSSGRAVSLLPSKNADTFKLNNIKMLPIQPEILCNVVAVLAPNINDKPNKKQCRELVSYIQIPFSNAI